MQDKPTLSLFRNLLYVHSTHTIPPYPIMTSPLTLLYNQRTPPLPSLFLNFHPLQIFSPSTFGELSGSSKKNTKERSKSIKEIKPINLTKIGHRLGECYFHSITCGLTSLTFDRSPQESTCGSP
jgi:hypothetical protein